MNRYEIAGWFLGTMAGLALSLLVGHLTDIDFLWMALLASILSGGLSLVGVAVGNAFYLRHLRAETARLEERSR